ncbi:ABC transporter E family member 2 [Aduncisulcus paluster]|uniref:ABC transporter E family member 2 n=1 Tax=Aduncisulcus paluster TaxID=2918883 RepID=A0ABQ5KS46_9EUKA|nr:ABC transporter E family member 2 [Aduncisulcus paluster]
MSKTSRTAIVNPDRCKPEICSQECRRVCPVVKMGKRCIVVTKKIAMLSETLCIGCGICPGKCPFKAITIINLPSDLDEKLIYRYGRNAFKLHRLPTPRPGQILGLLGQNGIGKSTALRIMAGKLVPNFGNFKEESDWEDVCEYFRGSELQAYFKKVVEQSIVVRTKPQYVDVIPKKIPGSVGNVLMKLHSKPLPIVKDIIAKLDLVHLLKRKIKLLSGGELQRFACALSMVQTGTMYMFDEPSSYLDVKQRLTVARMIRDMIVGDHEVYSIVVEHDLAILDYLSDFVCVLYGTPGVYGVITFPFNVRDGINVFLAGFIQTENMRFRDYAISFKMTTDTDEEEGEASDVIREQEYPDMRIDRDEFHLTVEAGKFRDSEIVVLIGENGMGKTTLIRALAGMKGLDPKELDSDDLVDMPSLSVSMKPQKLSPSFEGTVEQLLKKRIRPALSHAQFQTDVFKPMNMDVLMDRTVTELSGGELQRVAIVMALGKPADVYLLDEPSAYLDAEQRMITAKVIKRFILHSKKTAFVVEHDFLMSTYLADRVIIYSGEPGVKCTAHAPQGLVAGMNTFLKSLDVTFRRDPTNFRPRINKFLSQKDKEQKATGDFFFEEK